MAWRTFFKERIRLPASELRIDVLYLQGLAFSAILPPRYTLKWGRLELWQLTHHSTKKTLAFESIKATSHVPHWLLHVYMSLQAYEQTPLCIVTNKAGCQTYDFKKSGRKDMGERKPHLEV